VIGKVLSMRLLACLDAEVPERGPDADAPGLVAVASGGPDSGACGLCGAADSGQSRGDW
jgi:hypothetical protein